MAIAFDAATYSLEGGVGLWEFVHTPVGTPNGILLLIVRGTATDEITGVTYGGVAMTEVTGSPLLYAGAEPFGVFAYFLGSGIGTGAQTIAISKTGSVNNYCWSYSVTAAGDTVVADQFAISGDAANPSSTLVLGGASSFCAIAFGSGVNDRTSATPLTGWTDRTEEDLGTRVCGSYSYDTIGTSDVTAGFTAGADDYAIIGVALKEASGGTTAVSSDLGDSYALRSNATSDLGDSYTLRADIASDLADSYALRANVSGDLADSYLLRANVSSDLADEYYLLTSVGNDFADSYLLRNYVGSDLGDSYLLDGAAVVLSAQRTTYSNTQTAQRSNTQTAQRSNTQTAQRSNTQTAQRSNTQTARRPHQ